VKVGFRPLDSKQDWEWFIERNPLTYVADMKGIIAVNMDNGDVLAGCVMDTWTETSCQVHFAIDNPFVIRHGFFNEVSRFVFDTAGRLTMYALIPANNAKSLSVANKIGFKEVTRLSEAFKRGVDYVLLELRKSHCNFNAIEDL